MLRVGREQEVFFVLAQLQRRYGDFIDELHKIRIRLFVVFRRLHAELAQKVGARQGGHANHTEAGEKEDSRADRKLGEGLGNFDKTQEFHDAVPLLWVSNFSPRAAGGECATAMQRASFQDG